MTPTFQGEVQMRRWSDSSTQGVQITFALHDSEALEPLKHKAGKRFACVLVEIGDDEQPVEPPKAKPGPLCREAIDLCARSEFWEWIEADGVHCPNEAGAKAFVLAACGVRSRKQLDEGGDPASLFIGNIRIPFLKHMRARRAA